MSSEKMTKYRGLVILAVIVVLAAFIGVNVIKERGEVYEVRTGTVKVGDITRLVSGYGKIQAEKEVGISAYVAAEIKKLWVDEGAAVEKGQLLVELDRSRYDAVLDRYQSDFLSTRASLENARLKLKRAKELFSNQFIARSELEEAELNFELAKRAKEQSEANIKSVKDDIAKTRLNSPISGTVIALNKEEGEMALSSQLQADVIMTIGDLSRMEMVVEVDESDVALVSIGDKANIEVDALPERRFNGQVTEIANKATTRGRGTQDEVTIFEVKIRVTDSDIRKLRSGMSATVDIETDTHGNVLYVPIQAITTREVETETVKENKNPGSPNTLGSQVVFVVENNKVRMAPVKTGIMNETDVEITGGLEKDQTVVIGSFRTLSRLLKDGSRVKINNSLKQYYSDDEKDDDK